MLGHYNTNHLIEVQKAIRETRQQISELEWEGQSADHLYKFLDELKSEDGQWYPLF